MIADMAFRLATRLVQFSMDLDPSFHSDLCINYALAKHKQPVEPEVCDAMARILREGDTAIDAGANVGFMTLLMSRLVGASGRVLAFEPAPQCVAKLKQNLIINDIRNVDLIPQPLGRTHNEQATLYLHARNGESSLYEHDHITAEVPVTLSTIDWFDTHPRLIKVDTEGSECDVLRGAEKTLDRLAVYVIAELNNESLKLAGETQRGLRSLMFRQGYQTFLLDGAFPIHIPAEVEIFPNRPNTNVLFSTLRDIVAAWPECRL